MNIAIIPARGGSKRIPKKNIKKFYGLPVIAYSIKMALSIGCFNEVMVSTDDDEIKAIAIKYGAKVPFKRSKKNSNDFSTTSDVLKEVIESYELKNQYFDYACCIYPTAPLIREQDIIEGYNKLIEQSFHSVIPVVPFSFPVQRALKFEKEKLKFVNNKYATTRSQDLEKRYHDAGQWYWLKIDEFKKNNVLYSENTGYIELNEDQVQDIDNKIDWKLAELKFELIQSNK